MIMNLASSAGISGGGGGWRLPKGIKFFHKSASNGYFSDFKISMLIGGVLAKISIN
jgi:hypothetical protein